MVILNKAGLINSPDDLLVNAEKHADSRSWQSKGDETDSQSH
jgi:hypothetical protein